MLLLAPVASLARPLPLRRLPTNGQLAVGTSHSLLVRPDGSLYAWGDNSKGQLGIGSTIASSVPVLVSQGDIPANTRFVQIAAGGAHSLALAADGTLYAWGYNGNGQLGNGSAGSDANPLPVLVSPGDAPAGTRFVQIAASNGHSLVLAADGTLYAWGDNSSSELGNGQNGVGVRSLMPVAVSQGAAPAGTRFVQVASGRLHSLALAADGTIYAWGSNYKGQLGIDSHTDSSVPAAEYYHLTQWWSLAAGSSASHSLVLGAGAAVFTAGSNEKGQLGDGTTTDSPVFIRKPLPVQLTVFTARLAEAAGVQLAWATASEVNSAYFAVERSPDGVTFAEVGRVAAAGSSPTARTYRYADAALPAGAARLYYRLRQVDLDGTTTYSAAPVVALRGAAAGLSLYPNPAQAGITTLAGAAPGAAVQVLDGLGRLVLSTPADATGTAPLALPAGLAPGVYLVRTGAQARRLSVQ